MSIFDKSSGLVYTETTSPRVQSMIPTWTAQTRGRKDDPQKYLYRDKGCPSLQQMALRACVWHVDDMEPESLQWLGWHYASRIYERLKQIDSLTFNSWCTFQKAFPENIDRHHSFYVAERDAWSLIPVALPSMTTRLASLDTDLLTFLCIKNFVLIIDHLMLLTKIPTLAALVLEQKRTIDMDEQHVTGRNIRNWARAAYENQSLTKLTLLVLAGVEVDRNTIIKSVSSFPALSLFGVRNTTNPQGEFDDEWYTMSSERVTETFAPDHRYKSPHQVWKDQNVTKAQKIYRLYRIASGFARDLDVTTKEFPTVTLSYVCNEWSTQEDSLAWFFRKPTDNLTRSRMKHTMGDEQQDKEDGLDKRRKVRATKKVDVGSLLSTFV